MIFLGIYKVSIVEKFLADIVIVHLLLAVARKIIFFYGAFRDKVGYDRKMLTLDDETPSPRVTILVPAYNEKQVIADTVTNLSRLNYPNYEIIVIDDGSRDATSSVALVAASKSLVVPIKVLYQPNAGKAAALNNGLAHAEGDLILCVDADSRLHPDTLKYGVRDFEDPKVAASAGFVEIANQHLLITQFQQLEYLTALNFIRRPMSWIGAVPIIPGPIGLFRREALADVRGYNVNKKVFAEDAELTLRMLARGWKVVSNEDMIAYTEAPENLKTLLRQRYRWNRGILQALNSVFWELIFKNGKRGLYLVTFFVAEFIVIPLVNFGLVTLFLTRFLFHGDLTVSLHWFGYLVALDLLTSYMVTYRHSQLLRWTFITILSKISYSYFLSVWRILCMIEEWQDKEMSWDKLERTGNFTMDKAG